jgi:hypothetical protein
MPGRGERIRGGGGWGVRVGRVAFDRVNGAGSERGGPTGRVNGAVGLHREAASSKHVRSSARTRSGGTHPVPSAVTRSTEICARVGLPTIFHPTDCASDPLIPYGAIMQLLASRCSSGEVLGHRERSLRPWCAFSGGMHPIGARAACAACRTRSAPTAALPRAGARQYPTPLPRPPHAGVRPVAASAGRRVTVRVSAAKQLNNGRTTVKSGAPPAAGSSGACERVGVLEVKACSLEPNASACALCQSAASSASARSYCITTGGLACLPP